MTRHPLEMLDDPRLWRRVRCAACVDCRVGAGNPDGKCIYGGPFSGYVEVEGETDGQARV